MKNVRVLQNIMIKGNKVNKGEVIAKTDFPAKQDWMNLLHMPKPRVEETSDAVGKPSGKKAAMPGA